MSTTNFINGSTVPDDVQTWRNWNCYNLNVQGTLTAPNTVPIYGYYVFTGSSSYGVGSYNSLNTNTSVVSNGITKTSATVFTLPTAGTYKVDFNLMGVSLLASYPTRVDVKLTKSSVDVTNATVSSQATNYANITGEFIVTCLAGDTLEIKVQPTTNALQLGAISGNSLSICIQKL